MVLLATNVVITVMVIMSPMPTNYNWCTLYGNAIRSEPPSCILENYFNDHDGCVTEINEEEIVNLAKKCLVSPDDVKLWLEHLRQVAENRRKGVVKAKATRERKSTLLWIASGWIVHTIVVFIIYCYSNLNSIGWIKGYSIKRKWGSTDVNDGFRSRRLYWVLNFAMKYKIYQSLYLEFWN